MDAAPPDAARRPLPRGEETYWLNSYGLAIIRGGGTLTMRLIICGIAGKMGQRLVACARAANHAVVGGVESPAHPLCGRELDGVPVRGSLAACAVLKPDAVIDFSAAAAAAANAAACAKLGLPLVVGTTGLGAKEKAALKKAAAKIPVVEAPNMSLGVNLLFNLTEKVAQALGAGYDIEIVEAHHRLKKDAPSGTAIGLLNAAARGRKLDPAKARRTGRDGMVGARTEGEIGVFAVRAGDIIGEHPVMFCGENERLELTHRAHSRDAFARGAVRAAVWAKRAKRGLYDMQAVLGLR